MIYNIQRYSTHDGQGIRTVIFYKGCTLRCKWCSNPESQSFLPEIMYNHRICKKFGDCITVARGSITRNNDTLVINREQLKDPEILKDACMSRALTVIGEKKSTGQILNEVEKDISFYRQSKGGVTLSGGEPLAQDEGLRELLKELRLRKIHISIETSLHVKWDNVFRCLGYIDTYLIDLKHIDPVKFKQYTAGNLNMVLKNLAKLAALGENIIIRIPVIPEFNHTLSEMIRIVDYICLLKTIKEVHFIPYHTLGMEKYLMSGRNYDFGFYTPVSHSEMKDYVTYAHSKGLKTMIGG